MSVFFDSTAAAAEEDQALENIDISDINLSLLIEYCISIHRELTRAEQIMSFFWLVNEGDKVQQSSCPQAGSCHFFFCFA